jgi:hypothetical protein
MQTINDRTTILLKVALNTHYYLSLRFMVFNATFNNISVILWQSVLLGEETEIPGENHQPVASH